MNGRSTVSDVGACIVGCGGGVGGSNTLTCCEYRFFGGKCSVLHTLHYHSLIGNYWLENFSNSFCVKTIIKRDAGAATFSPIGRHKT